MTSNGVEAFRRAYKLAQQVHGEQQLAAREKAQRIREEFVQGELEQAKRAIRRALELIGNPDKWAAEGCTTEFIVYWSNDAEIVQLVLDYLQDENLPAAIHRVHNSNYPYRVFLDFGQWLEPSTTQQTQSAVLPWWQRLWNWLTFWRNT